MDFQQATVQIQDTLIVMAEIQRRQADVHEARMNHVDERLSEITDKLDGLIGLDGHFGKH